MSKNMNIDMDTEVQAPLYDEDLSEMDFSEEEKPRRRRPSIWLIVISVVLVLALAGGGLLYWNLSRPTPVQYTQAAATTGNLSVKISATGPIEPNAQYNMDFASAGQISEIDVQPGQQVKKGQVLAKLTVDTTTLQQNVQQSQLNVTSAQEALATAQQAVTTAQTNYNNQVAQNNAALAIAQDTETTDLAACKATDTTCQQTAKDRLAQTQAQLNSSNTSAANQITSSQNQVTSAQNALDKANASLATAQYNVTTANTNAVLTSPANATVAAVNGIVGESATASGTVASTSSSGSSNSSSSSAFIVLIDTGKLSITAAVNEVDVANVQVGQPAQFTLSAYSNSIFRATVTAINTIGVTSSSIVTYGVSLAVDVASLQNMHVYPGMTATVSITTQQRIGVLTIPAAALSFPAIALQNGEISRAQLLGAAGSTAGTGASTGGTSTGTTRTVLELKNGKLVPVSIVVGLTSGTLVEVISGLNDGDQVVTGQTGGNTTTSTTTTRTGAGAGGFGGGAGGFGGGAGGFGGGTGRSGQ